MTAKHTPGPWSIDAEVQGEAVLGPDGIMVADCAIFGFGKVSLARSDDINRANARLIAAAPELAEALLNTLQFAEACHRQCDDALMRKAIGADIMRAREALEKAGVA